MEKRRQSGRWSSESGSESENEKESLKRAKLYKPTKKDEQNDLDEDEVEEKNGSFLKNEGFDSKDDDAHIVDDDDDSYKVSDYEDKEPLSKEEIQDISKPYNSLLHGCRSVDCYERLNKIDEGTYGVVSRARDKATGTIVALKQVKMSKDVCTEGFPITALRETNVLLALHHPNIIQVREMVVGSTPDKIFMVMDYADHDLKSIMENKLKHPFLQSEVKCLMLQLLSAVAYMHENWYIHRDLKTSNLLYDNTGTLSVCDFGLARKVGSPIRSYTHMVVTLWYRAPELLMGATTYTTAIDMWSVGCIFAEIVMKKPLFPAKSEIELLDTIFKLLGAPSEENWPGYSSLPNANSVKWKAQSYSKLREKFHQSSFSGGAFLSNSGLDLLRRLLTLDPKQRITAEQALKHEYFREVPLAKAKELMPTYPS